MAVAPGVVGEHLLRPDAELGEVGQAAFDEGGHGHRSFVAMQLAVGVTGVVVDERVHPFVADPLSFLGTRCEAVAGAGPLIQPRRLALLLRRARDPGSSERPPDGRVRMTDLASDQSWPPAGP